MAKKELSFTESSEAINFPQVEACMEQIVTGLKFLNEGIQSDAVDHPDSVKALQEAFVTTVKGNLKEGDELAYDPEHLAKIVAEIINAKFSSGSSNLFIDRGGEQVINVPYIIGEVQSILDNLRADSIEKNEDALSDALPNIEGIEAEKAAQIIKAYAHKTTDLANRTRVETLGIIGLPEKAGKKLKAKTGVSLNNNTFWLALTTGASAYFTHKLLSQWLQNAYIDAAPGSWQESFLGGNMAGLDGHQALTWAGVGAAALLSGGLAKVIQSSGGRRALGALSAAGIIGILSIDAGGSIVDGSRGLYLDQIKRGTADATREIVDPNAGFTTDFLAQVSPASVANRTVIATAGDKADELSRREVSERGGSGPVALSYSSVDTGELPTESAGNPRLQRAYDQLQEDLSRIPNVDALIKALKSADREHGLDDVLKFYLQSMERQLPQFFDGGSDGGIKQAFVDFQNAESPAQLKDAQDALVAQLEAVQEYINSSGDQLAQAVDAYNQYLKALQEAGNASYTTKLPIVQVDIPKIEIDLSDEIAAVRAGIPDVESKGVGELLSNLLDKSQGYLILLGLLLRMYITDAHGLLTLSRRSSKINKENKPKEEQLSIEFLEFCDEVTDQINTHLSKTFGDRFKPYKVEDVIRNIEDLLADENPAIADYQQSSENKSRVGKTWGFMRPVAEYVEADPTTKEYERLALITDEFQKLTRAGGQSLSDFARKLHQRFSAPYVENLEHPEAVGFEQDEERRAFNQGRDQKHLTALTAQARRVLETQFSDLSARVTKAAPLVQASDYPDLKVEMSKVQTTLDGITESSFASMDLSNVIKTQKELGEMVDRLDALEAESNAMIARIDSNLSTYEHYKTSLVQRVTDQLTDEFKGALTGDLNDRVKKYTAFWEALDRLEGFKGQLEANPYLVFKLKERGLKPILTQLEQTEDAVKAEAVQQLWDDLLDAKS